PAPDPTMRQMLRTALFATCLALCGCASADGFWVELAGERYTVEVAVDEAARARADVPRLAARRPRHALHPRSRGAAGLLDEEHPDRAGHPVLRQRTGTGVAATRRAAMLGRQRLSAVPQPPAGALRARA